MGLFDFLKSKTKTFVSADAYNANCAKQVEMTPQVISQLRSLNVTQEKLLKLEYFFYTNAADKASQLASQLKELAYSVEHGVSAGDKKLFVITGWTTKLKMADDIIVSWTNEMCSLGYRFDCEFDGWGTNPNQE